MAKAAKKSSKKKSSKASKAKKPGKSKKKPARKAPARKSPAKKAPGKARKTPKRKPAKRKPARKAPPAAEPWPVIFAVLLALAVAVIAGWHVNTPALADGLAQAAAQPVAVAAHKPTDTWLTIAHPHFIPTLR